MVVGWRQTRFGAQRRTMGHTWTAESGVPGSHPVDGVHVGGAGYPALRGKKFALGVLGSALQCFHA